MRILHVPYCFYPDPVGGTEVYVSALSRRLREQGVNVEIAAPGETAAEYLHEGITVHRFGVTSKPADVEMLYGEGDPEAARQFAGILDRSRPDLVHLHALSPAVSLLVVREIRRRGIPVVFTCHVPGVTCARGTLLRNGSKVCDGVWELRKCTSCTLQSRGAPVPLAELLSMIPAGLSRHGAALGLRGSLATAIRMRGLQAIRWSAVSEFLRSVDRIVAVSSWLRDVLIANGVAADRVVLCRHGATQEADMALNPGPSKRGAELRVAYIGRLEKIKGVHVLIEALQRRPRLAIKLDIYGVLQDQADYADTLRRHASGDTRVKFLSPLPNAELVRQLQGYDLLAVPSQWMETGPLVVYDAFSAGIPVLGSNRGGISELVTHGRDGLLVDPSDPEAWAETLSRLAEDRRLLEQLRSGVRPPRSMAAVATEMAGLYEELAARRGAVLCGERV